MARKTFTLVISGFFLFFLVFPTLAQTNDEQPKAKLRLNFPQILGGSYNDPNQVINIDIADYIGALYQYALSIVGLVAVAMIMFGGVIWLTAGGNASRVDQAKEMISGAVIGLLIALFSYTLLQTINPALTRLEVPKIPTVQKVDLRADPVIHEFCLRQNEESCKTNAQCEWCERTAGLSGCAQKGFCEGFEPDCDQLSQANCNRSLSCIWNGGACVQNFCHAITNASDCNKNENCLWNQGLKYPCEQKGKKLPDQEQCKTNDQCESQKCISGFCSSGKESQFCFSDADCVSNLRCETSNLPGKMECVKISGKRQAGAVCDSNDQCITGKCVSSSVGGKRCGGQGGPGALCFTSDDCVAGLYCNVSGFPLVCREKRASGESCGSDEECLSDNCTLFGRKCE